MKNRNFWNLKIFEISKFSIFHWLFPRFSLILIENFSKIFRTEIFKIKFFHAKMIFFFQVFFPRKFWSNAMYITCFQHPPLEISGLDSEKIHEFWRISELGWFYHARLHMRCPAVEPWGNYTNRGRKRLPLLVRHQVGTGGVGCELGGTTNVVPASWRIQRQWWWSTFPWTPGVLRQQTKHIRGCH